MTHPFNNRTPRRRGRWLYVAAAVLASVGGLASTRFTGAAVAENPNFREIGQLPFQPPADTSATSDSRTGGTLVFDVPNRLGVRIMLPTIGKVALSTFDLDTLQDRTGPKVFPVRPFDNPSSQVSPPAVIGGGKLYLTDAQNQVFVFDTATLTQIASFAPPLGALSTAVRTNDPPGYRNKSTGEGSSIAGLAYRTRPGQPPKLLVMTELYPVHAAFTGTEQPNIVSVSQWDAVTGAEEWVTNLGACRSGRGIGSSKYGMQPTISERNGVTELIFGCVGRGGAGEVWRVELPASGTGTGTETLAASVPSGFDFYPDAIGRRVVVQTSSGTGQSFVGVDLDRRGVYGAVQASLNFVLTASPASSLLASGGIDPMTGRLFAFTSSSKNELKSLPASLITTDVRRSPLPQGLSFPDLNPGDRGGWAPILIDPATASRPRRVFVRYSRTAAGAEAEPFYRVYEDSIPLQRDVALGDIDRLTTDVPEQAGHTYAGFNAGASAFGFRQIFVGGYAALPDPLAYQAGTSLTKDAASLFLNNPCGSTDREVTFAPILRGTGLSDTGASASAAGAQADPRTVQDLRSPTASCPFTPVFAPTARPPDTVSGPADAAAGQDFDFSVVVCSPGETKTTPDSETFKASVDCSADGKKLTASSQAHPEAGTMPFKSAETSTTIERLPEGGVKATTTATVEGVSFVGVLDVGRVTNTATSTSAGRPGTAKVTSFHREWCDVAGTPGCIDPDDPKNQPTIDNINKALTVRDYRLEVPPFDADLRKGTPGGVLAGLQKDRFTSIGDRLINNDNSTALPALQLIHLHDSGKGRGRQVYQFAAVEASTAYFISLLSDLGTIDQTATLGLIPLGPEAIDDGASAALDIPTPAAALPTAAGPRTTVGPPHRGLAALIYAIRRTLQLIIRDPWMALSVFALIFAAFALPIHLFERRQTISRALVRSRVG